MKISVVMVSFNSAATIRHALESFYCQTHADKELIVVDGASTDGTRQVIEQVLAHLGIRHLFAAVVTSEDVVHQKPAPDIFLEAAVRIGVPPHLCRAYEDTDLGMEAIRAAGMEAVDVRHLVKVK